MHRLPLARISATTFALAALLSLTAFSSRPAHASPEGSTFEITPYAGYAFFIDPFSSLRLGRIRAKDDVHYGGSIGWQLSPLFGVQAGLGHSLTQVDQPKGRNVSFWHGHGDLLVSPFRTSAFDLYGLLGGGIERFSIAGGKRDFASFDAGAGLRLWLTDHIAVRGEARNILILRRKPDASSDNYAVVLAGLTLALGGKLKDADGDKVPDKRDACPDTPAGAMVDSKGCPTDADGDGVFDGLDKCPDTAKGARVDASGCPTDSDGDGVFDGLDQCSDTPSGATVDAKGCPTDADGDGVFDGVDKCPDTPKGATVDANGCPTDSDADGVPDGLDKCANTPAGARVDRDGCPIEVTEKETELLDTGMIRLQNVNFETAKATLLPESYPVLDVVGQVLNKWPELKIEIGGHTDSRGSNAYNQRLSEARANAVNQYLFEKFPALKADQFTVKGYGESKPLVPNTNTLNMAKNRRVEFVVQNKEVLRKEVERRKLLKP